MACGCENITPDSEFKDGICEVCRIQEGDRSIKKVKYCEFCKVNICCECNTRYDQRFFAALKLRFGLA